MGYLQKAVSGLVVASICLSAAAQEGKSKAAQEAKPKAAQDVRSNVAKPKKIDYGKAQKVTITEGMRANFAKFIEARRALLAKSETFEYQGGVFCAFEIPVILVPDPAKPADVYCVAVFPENIDFPGTLPTASEKAIVWRLIPPSPAPANATFTFFDKKDHGIIVLSDNSSQLKNGALGDGTLPLDPTKYMYQNKHKVKDKAVYLPIVVRTDTDPTNPAKKKVSVCGTPDPTISNVD
jgi:hypothetical protein